MLLRGLSWLVLCQLLGTALNVLLMPMLPGPIIGMLLLFVFLLVRGEVGEQDEDGALGGAGDDAGNHHAHNDDDEIGRAHV
jgi:hypothetical protein